MQLIEFGASDPHLIDGVFDLLAAAHAADTPENPVPARRFFETTFTHQWPGRNRRWFAAVADGRAIGHLNLTFQLDSNPRLAQFRLVVHPEHRAGGVGSALLDRAVGVALGQGRDTLVTSTPIAWEGGPARSESGARFLENRGFSRALTSVNHRCAVDAIEPSEEDRLFSGALEAAGDDYELRQWIGRVPDDLVNSLCRMETMILSEVPLGELDMEPEEADVEKVRAAEAVNEAEGYTVVHSVAVRKTTGVVVAWSELGVNEGPYAAAHQGITIVDPAHRGHRLGLLTKLANLRQLREHFGHVTEVWTDNADVNDHMIAINETLGYTTVDAVGEYQRKLEV